MRRKGKGVSYAVYGYLFCLPFVLAFLIFSLYPIIYTFTIGFTDLKGIGMTDFNFLKDPLQNFKTILDNPSFRVSLQNTAIIWSVNFLPQIFLALVITAWFTSRTYTIKGQGLFKVLMYMPNIITAATIAMLFNSLFGYPTGPVNDLLMRLGFTSESTNFLLQGSTAKGVVAFIQFWMWYGHTALILISGVMGMNPQMFEAAEIDGASAPQIFLRITIPNLRTILVYTLITSMIGGLQMFDIPRAFLNGGPSNATLTASLFIYNQAFSGSYLYARAAAASILLFLIIIVLSVIIFFLLRDKDEIEKRKAEKKMIKAMKAAGGAVR